MTSSQPAPGGNRGLVIAAAVVGVGLLALVALVVVVALVIMRISVDADRSEREDMVLDLTAAAAAQERHRAEHGTYTDSYDELEAAGYRSVGVSSSRIEYATATAFCMADYVGTTVLHVTQDSAPADGPCPAGP